jgi:hypothetical protein
LEAERAFPPPKANTDEMNPMYLQEHDPVHDKLILLGGDKYKMTDVAVTALADMLKRSTSYLTERYAVLCAERTEQREKEALADRGVDEAAAGAGRPGGATGSGLKGDALKGASAAAAAECRGLETYTAMFCRQVVDMCVSGGVSVFNMRICRVGSGDLSGS